MGGSPPSPRGPLAAPHLHLNCERNSSGESGGGRRKNRSSLREKFIKTNVDIILLGCFVAYSNSFHADATSDDGSAVEYNANATIDDNHTADDNHTTVDPTYAILYPWFTQTIAVLIYYVLSRYLTFLPYTAIVFLLGFAIGYATEPNSTNAIGKSALLWLGINGQVILLIFLPGLIFLDAITINVHLFFQAFWQLIIFAFPMVLCGTALTACVAKFFLGNWSWNLCMTFGAILSGTDPIAVAGLLNALGAPPRLKMHISGESLLNDGSAMVFFNIFSQRYFFELQIPGFGKDIGWGDGFAMFFRLSLGGLAIGLAAGLGTIVLLKILNRRLSPEENVIQVVTLISISYLTYWVAEVLCLCSGIIATIGFGLTIKVVGESLINDRILTLHFFEVTGQLLNTLLFVLGGTLWGNIISNNNAMDLGNITFEGNDWGYLAALFIMLIIIRFALVFAFYPITTHLGIGTNIKESIFMAYGGFRGSVGIALSLSLYATLLEETDKYGDLYDEYREHVVKLFCMVGGISLFTLLVSGMTSKPLLQLLGFAASEKARHKVLANFRKQMHQQALRTYVRLLSQERFKGVDFSLVRAHVPFLREITFHQLIGAVEFHKNNTPHHLYQTPALEHIIPYLYHSLPPGNLVQIEKLSSVEQAKVLSHRRASVVMLKRNYKYEDIFSSMSSTDRISDVEDAEAIDEARLNFIEMLRSAYHHQIDTHELESTGELIYSLFMSLDFCEDHATKGLPMNDWEGVKVASATSVLIIDETFRRFLIHMKKMWRRKSCLCRDFEKGLFSIDQMEVWLLTRQALAFVRAHKHAEFEFLANVASTPATQAEMMVIEESKTQSALAVADLDSLDPLDKDRIKGHMLCRIILNECISYVDTLSKQQLIPEIDASSMLDILNAYVEDIVICGRHDHENKLNINVKVDRLRQLPSTKIAELNLWEAINELSRLSFENDSDEMRTNIAEVGESDELSTPFL